MKKLIKLDFDNTTRERKTEDSLSELYSYDKNNGSFEFEILNDTLTTEQVIALFKFTDSNKIWKTTGTIEGNKVNVTFDTSLITQNETVICYLYFDEEQRTSDTFRFKFKVKVSEIDKMNRYEVKERFINNTVIVDRLDVVTKEELKEALKNVGGIATEGLLTEVKAEEIYAKKSEAVDNTNFELVKNRVLALELKTDKDTVYDDSEVKERLTMLENKPPVDLSGYATKEELRNVSGSQPNVDNLVTKDELENKHYISDVSNLATKEELNEVRNSQPTVDTSHLVTREELEEKHYLTEIHLNSSELAQRVTLLEEQPDKDTVYDDTPLKERVTALESKAIEGGAYDDKPIRDRLDVLEAKHDNDTIYDDTEVKRRLTELEGKPVLDTSFFITEEKLNSKGYLTQHQSLENVVTKEELESKGYLTTHQDISNLATKEELANVVTKEELNNKHYVTEEELNNKAYLTSHQDLSNYALKSELPQPYNDTPLKERVEVLETKVDKDTVYNDTELRNRVEVLENKPNVDLTNYVTTEQLENKHYLTQHQSLDNLVTKEELNSKGYVTEGVLNGKNYLTEHQSLEEYAKKSELYNDTEVKERLTTLESKPNIDTSNFVTNEQLESKQYLTEHQPLTHLATTSDLEVLRNISVNKAELSKKLDTTEFDLFKDSVVTKTELVEKGYLTSHQDLSEYALKSEIPQSYSDTDLKNRVVALENRPTGGGTQVQETGWIKLSDETMTAGSIVEIRRINNMVHVRFRNEQGNHFIVNPQIENNTLLTKQISTGFGSVVNNSLMILNENKSKSLGVVSTEINNGNLQITIHIANSDYSNEFGVSVYVNEFTYITDEPFPTNLH